MGNEPIFFRKGKSYFKLYVVERAVEASVLSDLVQEEPTDESSEDAGGSIPKRVLVEYAERVEDGFVGEGLSAEDAPGDASDPDIPRKLVKLELPVEHGVGDGLGHGRGGRGTPTELP